MSYHQKKWKYPWILFLLLILYTHGNFSLADSGTAENTLKLGYRSDAPPFSYVENQSQKESNSPIGYSVDLCERIGRAAKKKKLCTFFEFVEVSAENRFQKLNSGEIDILCEATTVTLERIRRFDSTLYTFLSGASFMYPAHLKDINDKDFLDKTIGVLKNTTTQNSLYNIISKKIKISADLFEASDLKLEEVTDHYKSIELFKDKEIDIYFADRDVLLALKQRAAKKGLRLNVSRRYFTNEPYALFVRKNSKNLLYIANKTLVELYRSGEIMRIFAPNFPGFIISRSLRDLFSIQSILDGEDPLPSANE